MDDSISKQSTPTFESGATIALLVQAPIYAVFRVDEHLGQDRYRGRMFQLPGMLGGTSTDVRVNERTVSLDSLRPSHQARAILKGDYVIVTCPQGVRIATSLHDVTGTEPALLLSGWGAFNFEYQQEVQETFTAGPAHLFPIAAYVDAR